MASTTKATFYKGQRVFEQGDPGDCAYLIESGEVGIIKTIDGEEVILATLRPGELFGEMAMIDGAERMASAVALDDTVLVKIPKTLFDAKLAQADPFIRAILGIFLGNIRNAHKIYIRKPRSFDDYVKLINSFSNSLAKYINLIEVSDFSAETAAALSRLDTALADLTRVARNHEDRRGSVVQDDEVDGVPAGKILGRPEG
ncbi:MAG: cyclic nucleotide-binding domain-containing protein [Rhodospirillales bacterium]|nr:cyclic nucleotide-binding domain-containing protein [Rhodospirillales bacterium]